MAGRKNRQEHKAKQAKKSQHNAKRVHKPVPIPGKPVPPKPPTIDLPTILAAMRKDYEDKLDPTQRRPGGEKIDEALFSVIEQAFGAVQTKQKKGKVNISVDNQDLQAKARPMVDTLADGLKEAFLAKWIPELTKVIVPPPPPEPNADGTIPEAAKTQFDAVDMAGLAALVLHRKKTPEGG